ncbi:MAG: hypothetical protein F6J97_02755 [Leptolyngbya sp. SIO4C1]|nr:hypothetical protein [Leptolyngbya sp. SIO4C1]
MYTADHLANPDHIHTVFAFPYHGLEIQITSTQHDGQTLYTAWVNYDTGSAVAVPKARSREEAIQRAKAWARQKFEWPT